jgi:hypothetical protein
MRNCKMQTSFFFCNLQRKYGLGDLGLSMRFRTRFVLVRNTVVD